MHRYRRVVFKFTFPIRAFLSSEVQSIMNEDGSKHKYCDQMHLTRTLCDLKAAFMDSNVFFYDNNKYKHKV